MKYTLKITLLTAVMLAGLSCKKDGDTFSGPVKADFKTESTSAEVGEFVRFEDLSEGKISRWNWHFEGGTPEESQLSMPAVQWMAAGTYKVTLTVSNKTDSDQCVKEGYVTIDWTTEINASFSFDRTSATNADRIKFTDESGGFPNSWLWTFTPDTGSPIVSTEQNPEIVLPEGIWTIQLTASNPVTSDSYTVSDAITVIDKDAVFAKFEAECPATYAGGSVKFKDISLGVPVAWEWEFEGGTPAVSNEQNPTVKYETAGRYKVKLRTIGAKTSSVTETENYVHVIPSDRLVFFLPFDGDIKDHGPYSIAVTSYELGGYTTSFSDPHPVDGLTDNGKSIYFPGGTKGQTYSVLQMSNSLVEHYPSGSDFSVSLWVKAAASSDAMAFFAQGSCPGVLSQGNNQAWARFQSGAAGIRLCVESYLGDSNTITSSTAYDDGQWHHVVFIYAMNSAGTRDASLWVDGVRQGTANNKPDKQIDTTPYFIGCNLRLTNGAWAPENMMKGCIDNYILYSRAISQNEIKDLYEKY